MAINTVLELLSWSTIRNFHLSAFTRRKDVSQCLGFLRIYTESVLTFDLNEPIDKPTLVVFGHPFSRIFRDLFPTI